MIISAKRKCLIRCLVIAVLSSAAGRAEAGTIFGVNAHNNWNNDTYARAGEEATFKLLSQAQLRSYRVDVKADAASAATLRRLVALGKTYRITIRPMLYVDGISEGSVADFVSEFADAIDLWELGNELNLRGVDHFDESIRAMATARRGVEQAEQRTGRSLKTAINVAAATSAAGLTLFRTGYTFLDRAVKLGLPFDYITFHYYPAATDQKGGWIKTYLEPLRQYHRPVLLNETNCSLIYKGDDGNSPDCARTVDGFIDTVEKDYPDMVKEIDLYELFDDPSVPGVEAHFGIMFDLHRPKATFDVVRRHASAGH